LRIKVFKILKSTFFSKHHSVLLRTQWLQNWNMLKMYHVFGKFHGTKGSRLWQCTLRPQIFSIHQNLMNKYKINCAYVIQCVAKMALVLSYPTQTRREHLSELTKLIYNRKKISYIFSQVLSIMSVRLFFTPIRHCEWDDGNIWRRLHHFQMPKTFIRSWNEYILQNYKSFNCPCLWKLIHQNPQLPASAKI
jgi:hypothetical protein